MDREIILFKADDIELQVKITPDEETVWLTQDQMAELFDKDRSVIGRHISNIFKEGELEEDTSVQILHGSNLENHRPPQYYNLDVIISVGYRVKSKRGIQFRRWANSVLKDYILKGYAVNNNRMAQLGEVIRIMKRTENSLDAKQVLSVIERYSVALALLDDYDHQTMKRPKGNDATYVLSYEECRDIIDHMKFSADHRRIEETGP